MKGSRYGQGRELVDSTRNDVRRKLYLHCVPGFGTKFEENTKYPFSVVKFMSVPSTSLKTETIEVEIL